jgi:hypothetical protein
MDVGQLGLKGFEEEVVGCNTYTSVCSPLKDER